MRLILIIYQRPFEGETALIMHELAKHFSIHHLFLLLKVQFIKCSAAARGDSGGDMDDQAQRSVRRGTEARVCHLILIN